MQRHCEPFASTCRQRRRARTTRRIRRALNVMVLSIIVGFWIWMLLVALGGCIYVRQITIDIPSPRAGPGPRTATAGRPSPMAATAPTAAGGGDEPAPIITNYLRQFTGD